MQNKILKRILACMLVTVSVITFSIPTFAGEGESKELKVISEVSNYDNIKMSSENDYFFPSVTEGASAVTHIPTYVGSTRVDLILRILPYQQVEGYWYKSAITFTAGSYYPCDFYFDYEGESNWGEKHYGQVSGDQSYGCRGAITLKMSCYGEYFERALAEGNISSDDGYSSFYIPLDTE